MHDKISLAWAVRVDYTQLGARLEAFVETKAAISTFRACVSHAGSKKMSKLPPEIISMIANSIKDIVYLPKIRQWLGARKCVLNKCRPRDHFTTSELSDFYTIVSSSTDVDEYLYADSMAIHERTARNHLKKITMPSTKKSVNKFAKCNKASLVKRRLFDNMFKANRQPRHGSFSRTFAFTPTSQSLKSTNMMNVAAASIMKNQGYLRTWPRLSSKPP